MRIPQYNTYLKYGCIAANAAVYVAWQFALRNGMLDKDFWASLDRKLRPGYYLRVRRWLENNFLFRSGDERDRPWTLVTSALSHIDFMHLSANLGALVNFVDAVSMVLSPIVLGGLLTTSAVAGNAAFFLQERRRKLPNRHVRSLGLSAVVMGLGGAAAVAFPFGKTNFLGVRIPLAISVAMYAAWDTLFLSSQTSTTGHAAHIGGAAAGVLYMLLAKQLGLSKKPMLYY